MRPGARWGLGLQFCQWALHPAASSPIRNQPEAARLLLAAGCQANALNGTRSTALHVAVQRGFLEVVRALCELGCDVNLPVSAGPLSYPWGQGVLPPADHWPTPDRTPRPTRPCTTPSPRAPAPVALWRSSQRCRASTSPPPTARASPCCTTRPLRATRCEFGVGTQPEQAPAALLGHLGAPSTRHLPAPQSGQEDPGLGTAAGGRQEGGWLHGGAPGRPQQPPGGGPDSHPRGEDRAPTAWGGSQGPRAPG